jgi:K+-transporting ATPase ATPase C chain
MWQRSHPAETAERLKANPDNAEPNPEDLAVPFFTSFSQEHPGTFPIAVEQPTADGKTEKVIQPVKAGTAIQAAFFDMWLQAHADVDLEPVPADMVMASGSGLDPHITLDNARFQLARVAAAWAKKTNRTEDKVQEEIAQLLQARSYAPLGGWVGVPLVNVLEINLALQDRYQRFQPSLARSVGYDGRACEQVVGLPVVRLTSLGRNEAAYFSHSFFATATLLP